MKTLSKCDGNTESHSYASTKKGGTSEMRELDRILEPYKHALPPGNPISYHQSQKEKKK